MTTITWDDNAIQLSISRMEQFQDDANKKKAKREKMRT